MSRRVFRFLRKKFAQPCFGWTRDASLDSAKRFGVRRLDAALDARSALDRRTASLDSCLQSSPRLGASAVKTFSWIEVSGGASRRIAALQRAASGGRGLRGNPKRRQAAALQGAAHYPERSARSGRCPKSEVRCPRYGNEPRVSSLDYELRSRLRVRLRITITSTNHPPSPFYPRFQKMNLIPSWICRLGKVSKVYPMVSLSRSRFGNL